jgi:hypothetical protein
MNATEVARTVKYWLTLKSDLPDGQPSEYVDLDLEPDIDAAKEGLDSDIETVRQQLANLLFGGRLDWLGNDDADLERTLPEWFLPGSSDEVYLEQYVAARTDVRSMLEFLGGLLTAWEQGEGRPAQNPDYEEATWPSGTRYYMFEGGQWLYSPVESGPGADWQTMDYWTSAAAAAAATAQPASAYAEPAEAPAAVDISTMEKAQEAAGDVATAAADILANVLRRNPECAEGVSQERMKELVLHALKTQCRLAKDHHQYQRPHIPRGPCWARPFASVITETFFKA